MGIEFNQNQPYKNLYLKSQIKLDDDICVIIGKNGAGKTRLLEGIKEGKVKVSIDGNIISTQQINHYNIENLKPSLEFGFDRIRFKEEIRSAIRLYELNKESFLLDKEQFLTNSPFHGRDERVNISAVYETVIKISNKKNLRANEICSEDISTYYTNITSSLGYQNVTATYLQYLDRLEENEANNALNKVYGYNLPAYTAEQFRDLYGPPPWELFNIVLKDILGNEYFVQAPKFRAHETYEAKLLRVKDSTEINYQYLSSGEKVLLWLAISIYNTSIFAIDHLKPNIILFDELDAFLHPQMIEKMYATFNKIIQNFNCKIVFTSHSPTTVALFQGESIYKISETSIEKINKDVAISELLDGVPQVSISYLNRRQVYVESHYDATIYQQIYDYVKSKKLLDHNYISLNFLPTGIKIQDSLLRNRLLYNFGELSEDKMTEFIKQIRECGNCSQVIDTVVELTDNGCESVFGIIDWDNRIKNLGKYNNRIYVSSNGLFYSLENVILNPLTLGLYFINNFRDEILRHGISLNELGGPNLNFYELYNDQPKCQILSDIISDKVIQRSGQTVSCEFYNGVSVNFDINYVHRYGHEIEDIIKEKFSFLKVHRNLLKEKIANTTMIWQTNGGNIPKPLLELFNKLQG